MATDKKRIIIYVHDDEKARIERVAKKMGSSVSSVCGDFLIQTLPQLEQIAETIQLARTNPAAAMEQMRSLADDQQGDLLEALNQLPDK